MCPQLNTTIFIQWSNLTPSNYLFLLIYLPTHCWSSCSSNIRGSVQPKKLWLLIQSTTKWRKVPPSGEKYQQRAGERGEKFLVGASQIPNPFQPFLVFSYFCIFIFLCFCVPLYSYFCISLSLVDASQIPNPFHPFSVF